MKVPVGVGHQRHVGVDGAVGAVVDCDLGDAIGGTKSLFQPVMMPSRDANRKVALEPLGRTKPGAVEGTKTVPLGEPVVVFPPVADGMTILNGMEPVAVAK